MGRILSILVALITMGTAAHATTLASGALYGGATQNLAVCYLYNAGDSQVLISAQIIREGAGPVRLAAQNCITHELNGLLDAGANCYISANIVNNVHHACEFFIDPDGALIRGTFELRSGGTVLQQQELR